MTRGLGWILIIAGVVVGQFVVYELWYSDAITAAVQDEAREEWDRVLEATPEPQPVTIDPEENGESAVDTEDELRLFPEEWPDLGEPIGRIIVPKVDLDAVVFAGVDTDTLRGGPGAMPGTSFPGQPGNATISGHRTTYGRPFHDFEELDVGDEIMMETGVGTHTYTVRRIFTVEPTGVWVTGEMTGAWLTLTACHPKFSAAQRLIVQAEMTDGPNAPYARHLAETEPPIPRGDDDQPLEMIAGDF